MHDKLFLYNDLDSGQYSPQQENDVLYQSYANDDQTAVDSAATCDCGVLSVCDIGLLGIQQHAQ